MLLLFDILGATYAVYTALFLTNIQYMIFYQNKKMIICVFSNGCFDSLRLLPDQRISQDAGADGDSHIHQADDNRPPE